MMLVLYFFSGVNGKEQRSLDVFASEPIAPRGQLVFSVSLGALIFVPGFRSHWFTSIHRNAARTWHALDFR